MNKQPHEEEIPALQQEQMQFVAHPVLGKYKREVVPRDSVELKRTEENMEKERVLCSVLHVTDRFDKLEVIPETTYGYVSDLINKCKPVEDLLAQSKAAFSKSNIKEETLEKMSQEEREEFEKVQKAWSLISWDRFVRFLIENGLIGDELWGYAKAKASECERNRRNTLDELEENMKRIKLIPDADLLKMIDKMEKPENEEAMDEKELAQHIRDHYHTSAQIEYERCEKHTYRPQKNENGEYNWNFVFAFVAEVEKQRCCLLKQQFGMDMVQYIQEFYKKNKTPLEVVLSDTSFSQTGGSLDAFYALFTADLNVFWNEFGQHHPYVKTVKFEGVPHHLDFSSPDAVCTLMFLFYILATDHQYKTEEAQYKECGVWLNELNQIQRLQLTQQKYSTYYDLFQRLDAIHKTKPVSLNGKEEEEDEKLPNGNAETSSDGNEKTSHSNGSAETSSDGKEETHSNGNTGTSSEEPRSDANDT